MKHLYKTLFIGLAFLVLPHFALASYGQYRTVTIDHTKVPNTDQTSFPVYVNGVYSYLATVANGGKIQNTVAQSGGGLGITVPADLVFASDVACSTKLNWEFSSYSATTGTVNIWVNVPTVSHTSDTVIYMCYGNAAISTWQGNVPGTWNSNYKYVLHMFDNAANTTVVDSTGNQSPTSINNTSGMHISGAFGGGGFTFNGTTDSIHTAPASSIATGGAYTFELWMKVANNNSGTNYMWDGSASGESSRVLLDAQNFGGSGAGAMEFYDGNFHANSGTGVVANNTWTSLAYTAASSVSTGYANGVAKTPTSTFTNFDPLYPLELNIGCRINCAGNPGSQWLGSLQEIRISGVTRSADWLATTYNSENSTSTFYTVGSETPIGGGVAMPKLIIGRGRLILGSFKASTPAVTFPAISFKQALYIGSSASPITGTFGSNVTAGSIITICSRANNNDIFSGSTNYAHVSDSLNTDYHLAVNGLLQNNAQNYIWWGYAPTGGSDTVTIKFANNGGALRSELAEYAGLSPVALDATTTNGGASGTSYTSNSTATRAVANELVYGCGTNAAGSSPTWTAGSGFTLRSANSEPFTQEEDQVFSSTGTDAATLTVSGNANQWEMSAATFKAPITTSYAQYRTITIDHTKVPATQVNFTIPVNGNYSYLATTGNGGKVQSAQGFDVGFYQNADCATSKLAWEQVGWNPSTGNVEYWVKIPSLSSSADTVIYMCYGDTTITTDQSATTTAWDSNYGGVWHLPNGTSLTALDSTDSGNNMVNTGASAVAGQIDGGASFASTNQLALGTGGKNLFTGSQTLLTVSGWIKKTTGTSQVILVGSRKGGNGYMVNINTDRSCHLLKASVIDINLGTCSPNDTNFHYYSFEASSTGQLVYVDGASPLAGTNTQNFTSLTGSDFQIGHDSEDTLSSAGVIDEVRVSATVDRGQNWQLTEYNSFATSTFYTVGAETPISPASGGGFVGGRLIIR